jgi:hypothetical protein
MQTGNLSNKRKPADLSSWTNLLSGASGSHGGRYEDDRLLGFITLMMEAVSTSETLVYFSDTTRRHIPEDCHLLAKWVMAKTVTFRGPYKLSPLYY